MMFGKEGLLRVPVRQKHAYGFGLRITERKYFEPC